MIDPGLDAIAFAKQSLQVDSEWTDEHERGFTWWGGALALSMWADPVRAIDGTNVARVHVRQDVLRDVAPVARHASLLGALSTGLALAAPLVDGDEPARLRLGMALDVFPGGAEWLIPHAAFAAALAASQAHAMAERLAEVMQATIDRTSHPRSGARARGDEMLFLLEHLVRPRGEEPSPWSLADAAAALDAALGPLGVQARRDGASTWASLPGARGEAVIVVTPAATRVGFGSGALVRAVSPAATRSASIQEALALTRTEFESATPAPLLGGWYPDGARLAHEVFLPSSCHDEGVLEGVILGAAMRLRWLDMRGPRVRGDRE